MRKTFLYLFIFGFFVSGCGNSYKQRSWTHLESPDWDIESAICLEESERFDEDDYKKIQRLEEAGQRMLDLAWQSELGNQVAVDSETDDAALLISTIVSGLIGFWGANTKTTARLKVIEEKFAECLKERGWTDAN